MIGWWVNVFWTEILLICLQKYIKIYIPVFRTMKMTWLHFAKSCITLLLRMVLIVIVLLVSMRCVLPILLYGPETWTLIQADWNKLDSFHVRCQRRILHISCHDFVSNDEVLHRTGLFDVSYIVRKRRLGLFGHVVRLRRDVPASQILQICTKTRDGERPSQEWRRACGRPSTTWTHQICCDTGVTATEALQLAEDLPFWRTVTTAGGSGWTFRVTMMRW